MSVQYLRKVCEQYFPGRLQSEILPCPLCNKDDRLWSIIESHQTSGVGCYRCRLKITHPFPRLLPKKFPKNIRVEDSSDWMYLYCFFICLKRWNKLPRR